MGDACEVQGLLGFECIIHVYSLDLCTMKLTVVHALL